jgi:hypothetical protein
MICLSVGETCVHRSYIINRSNERYREDLYMSFRYDERLKTKVEEFIPLVYTGFLGGLEHLKIETRLIDEKIVNTMGEVRDKESI